MDKLRNLYADVFGGEKIGLVDLSQPSLYISAASIAFNPIFWNIVARQEYHTHFLTRIFRSPLYGCYALAVTIFSLGIFRDYLFKSALDAQPLYPPIHQPYIAYGLIVAGNVLVLSSMWSLGLTGTYLGDYFGILMEEKVEGFPFNVTDAPMYWGSTCTFLGTSLLYGRAAGLLLTAEVFVMYLVALQFEEDLRKKGHATRDEIDGEEEGLTERAEVEKRARSAVRQLNFVFEEAGDLDNRFWGNARFAGFEGL